MKLYKFFIVLFFLFISNLAKADTAGAIIGGLIGAQFGSGNGKIAAAAIGAVIGDRTSNIEPNLPNSTTYYPAAIEQNYVIQQVPTYQAQPQVVYIYQSTPIYMESNHHHYH